MSDKLPYDQLARFADGIDPILLVGVPLALLAVIIIIWVALVVVRRSREREQIGPAMRLEPEEDVALTELPPESTSEALAKPKEAPLVHAVVAPSAVEEVQRMDRQTWMARLRSGLSKTRENLLAGLSGLFTGQARINEEVLERLHEVLYKADMGVKTTDTLVDYVRTSLAGLQAPTWQDVRGALITRVSEILSSADRPLSQPSQGPWVVLVVGVNGVGKTTTIGKLAAHYLAADQNVLLGAADTFRAAAIDQLKIWGDRVGASVIAHQQGSDPAAVTFDAVKAAKARAANVLLIDTAGRLHAKETLMAELGKIKRVISREQADAPHEVWLVLDATTGQNAVLQVKAFLEVVSVTGLIVTKLDGTAKGGVIVGIADQFQLPIRFIGVGEKAADLREFNPRDFAESLF